MITLRPPRPDELAAVSRLCLRSKAHWGYDAQFMSACAAELTVSEEDLRRDKIVVAVDGDVLVGVAHVAEDNGAEDNGAEENGISFLEKLFVEPSHMGKGVGRRLFEWSRGAARALGASQMIVEADPDAVSFYVAMKCRPAGMVASGSIPGRMLPRLMCDTAPSRVGPQ